MSTKISQLALWFVAIAVVQIFDIVLHAAIDQLETIRVMSNLVILGWVAFSIQPRQLNRVIWSGYVAMGGYLLLNIIFLVLEGVTNPNNGGAFRTLLFILVGLTIGLMGWTIRAAIQTAE